MLNCAVSAAPGGPAGLDGVQLHGVLQAPPIGIAHWQVVAAEASRAPSPHIAAAKIVPHRRREDRLDMVPPLGSIGRESSHRVSRVTMQICSYLPQKSTRRAISLRRSLRWTTK